MQENASLVASDIVARSAIIRGAVEAGKLRIVSAHHSLEDGSVSFLG